MKYDPISRHRGARGADSGERGRGRGEGEGSGMRGRVLTTG